MQLLSTKWIDVVPVIHLGLYKASPDIATEVRRIRCLLVLWLRTPVSCPVSGT
jgi:hypothetical protein